MSSRTSESPQRKSVAASEPSASALLPSRTAGGLLQRSCDCGGKSGTSGECDECSRKKLNRLAAGHAPASREVPSVVGEVLRSPGRPLDSETRAYMEPRLGHDFSKVRVHTDERAAESARAVEARAYTVGRDVVFAAGNYAPRTVEGRRLLAHELTHVVQQSSLGAQGSLTIDAPDSAAEREASQTADAIHEGGAPAKTSAQLTPVLSRDVPKTDEIIRENPYHPSPKIPDMDVDVVKSAEKAMASSKFQEAIDILLKEAVAINRVNLALLEGGTMKFDSTLKQEGEAQDPTRDSEGNAAPVKVLIGPPAFKQGVSWLYSTLLHEYTHVQQMQSFKANMPVTMRNMSSDPGQRNAGEVEAYAFEITHATSTGLNTSPKLVAELWGRLCNAFSFMMPFTKKRMEPIARKALDAAKKVVGSLKLDEDCLK